MSMSTLMPALPAVAQASSAQRPSQSGGSEAAQKFESQVKDQISASSKEDSQGRKPAAKAGDSSKSTNDEVTAPVGETPVEQGKTSTNGEVAAEAAMQAFSFMLAQETAAEVPVETTPIFDELAALVQETTGEPLLAADTTVPAIVDVPTELPQANVPVVAAPVVEPALVGPAIANVDAEPTLPVAAAVTAQPTPTPAPASAEPQTAPVVPVAAPVTLGQETTQQDTTGRQNNSNTIPVAVATTNVSDEAPAQFALPMTTSTTVEQTAAPRPVQAPPATTPACMLEQVRGPIGRLTTALPGEHTFTVNVTPENLGPVTVRAHITGDGIRVELIGATDAARDSLRMILNDLKRDLQSTGMNAQLNLSNETGNGAQEFGAQGFGGQNNNQKSLNAAAVPVLAEAPEVSAETSESSDALGVDILA